VTALASTPLQTALDDVARRLGVLDLGDAYEPKAPEAIVAAGLHRLVLPLEAGGFGATMPDACGVLATLGAIDGATALGFAMHVHVLGAAVDGPGWPPELLARVLGDVANAGALINNASTEEGGGSPARGAIPGTTATPTPDGGWRLDGEKTWTTWLPALRYAVVSARIGDDEPTTVGSFLVDLTASGVERLEGFAALGMRGSASGRLRLHGVEIPAGDLIARRRLDEPDVRGAGPGAWFAAAIAATYLGVGEGARRDVARWALDRRPGDGSTAVADIPSVQLRLGRIDAELRAARVVLLAAARRWDETRDATDLPLAKLVCTRAAVDATDEALRIAGGPGFLAGRLERAFRDARAGLINPPLEDVALAGFARAVLERERADP
jgi:alkylation response protein AidB-like acyl-CoA dehydrogenase